MKTLRFSLLILVLSGGLTALGLSAALAAYPEKPIKAIVGYGPGGGTDAYARTLAGVAPEFLNEQPLIVINRVGAAQRVAMKYVAQARPDGYTVMIASAGSLALGTMLQNDPIHFPEDMVLVAQIGQNNGAAVTNVAKPFKNLQDVIDYAKANPGKLRYAIPGRGSQTHMNAKSLEVEYGIRMVAVPFTGGGKVRAAILGEQVDLAFMGIQQTTGFEDKLRVLAVMREERDPIRKDVPSAGEQGIHVPEVYSPIMIVAPKGTPQDVVDYLSTAVGKMVAHKAFQQITKKVGAAAIYRDHRASTELLTKLKHQWTPLMDAIKNQK